MTELSSRIAIVAGDVTIDWNLARGPGEGRQGLIETWDDQAKARMYWQGGGAALLGELIQKVVDGLPDSEKAKWQVIRPDLSQEELRPRDPRFAHSHALWAPFDNGIWRVQGFLGLDRPGQPPSATPAALHESKDTDPVAADLIVLDDADLGFRDRSELWPKAIERDSERAWVVLKMSQQVAEGPLWEHLLKTCFNRLVVILTITDLRRTQVRITRWLSWERTAQDLVRELLSNSLIHGLTLCAHVIVSFGRAGAIRMSRDKDKFKFWLYYDPERREGDWEESSSGKMIGYTLTLTASIAREFLLRPEEPDLDQAIRSGIAAQRKLFEVGYGKPGREPDQADLAFPSQIVAEELAGQKPPPGQKSPLEFIELQGSLRQPGQPAADSAKWSILWARYDHKLEEEAQDIVKKGVTNALKGVPVGRFGGLVTVDRYEIECLGAIQSLVREYLQTRGKKPLSLAVFGPPGSGKSFAIEQVAQFMKDSKEIKIRVITFNLSQFDGPAGLRGAFHQVRDVGLSGQMPLVFWDEFDTTLEQQPLGWLRYFLSPMQDGTFEEGPITHPIGSCIFVFAGGTCPQMAQFGSSLGNETKRAAAKVPDFLSRLRGYIDILGPDPQPSVQGGDPFHIIRRAILLRSLFERNTPQLFHTEGESKILNIDPGVLLALLKTRRYKHGVRSMESLITMSSLANLKFFESSSLPAKPQLDLHVDSADFMWWLHLIKLRPELLDPLAKAVHKVFCDGLRREGWEPGNEKSRESLTHPLLIEYEKLPEDVKEANRTNARTIPQKLAAVGCGMVPRREHETPWVFTPDEVEKMAQIEHKLWMEAKLKAGYKLGPANSGDKLNEYLLPWDQVPEDIKQIDRNLVKEIQLILECIDYTVIKWEGYTGVDLNIDRIIRHFPTWILSDSLSISSVAE